MMTDLKSTLGASITVLRNCERFRWLLSYLQETDFDCIRQLEQSKIDRPLLFEFHTNAFFILSEGSISPAVPFSDLRGLFWQARQSHSSRFSPRVVSLLPSLSHSSLFEYILNTTVTFQMLAKNVVRKFGVQRNSTSKNCPSICHYSLNL